MIVLNAQGAKLAGQKLTLDGISPNAIVFADRPVRSAGHALTAHLLEEWSINAPDSFAKDPPNATVSVLNKAKAGVADAVVVLKSPKLEGDRLTFDVDVLEGDLAGATVPRRSSWTSSTCRWRDGPSIAARGTPARPSLSRDAAPNVQKKRHTPTKTFTKRTSVKHGAHSGMRRHARSGTFESQSGQVCACIICKE